MFKVTINHRYGSGPLASLSFSDLSQARDYLDLLEQTWSSHGGLVYFELEIDA